KNHDKVKAMMMGDADAWHQFMTKLSDVVGQYMLAQAEAGAQVLQLFDSWVGQLAPDDYRERVMPYSKRSLEIASAAGVPMIHFGTNTNGMLEDIRDAGGDVIGVDWRIDIDVAAKRLGNGVAVQGNLDPVALFAPWEELEPRAKNVLDRMKGRGGHIFNLGHGILPQTPVDNVKRLCEFVHEYTSE
ncbi:MAG: uroporphyrinogen decarboxylase family protein, partial [Chloroflexota bacterium]